MKMIEELLDRGEIAVLVTRVTGAQDVGAKLLVQENGKVTGSLGDAELDSVVVDQARSFLVSREDTRLVNLSSFDTSLLFERLQPAPRLVVCGAGHVGASLAKLAAFAGYQTTLLDDRPEFLVRERFPEKQIELIVADDWSSSVRD